MVGSQKLNLWPHCLTSLRSANKNLALNSIVGAAFGGSYGFSYILWFLTHVLAAAGQRCMALSVGKQMKPLISYFSQHL
jgi:hypothetical protein